MERFLTEREAAHITGFSVHWFRQRRVRGGGPPFMKVGVAIRYPADELLDWMNSFGVVQNTSQRPRGPRHRRLDGRDSRILRRPLPGGRTRVVLVEGMG